MKRLIMNVIVIVGFATTIAQKAEKFTINEITYYGTKAIPKEITGIYKYEKIKEPIVEIKIDGSGYFQLHGVKAYPVEYWIETDENGNIQKVINETNSNYQVVLILKYGSNGETGWRGEMTGKYDRIDVTMAFDLGYAISLGERFKKI